jgi:hypothetical protein
MEEFIDPADVTANGPNGGLGPDAGAFDPVRRARVSYIQMISRIVDESTLVCLETAAKPTLPALRTSRDHCISLAKRPVFSVSEGAGFDADAKRDSTFEAELRIIHSISSTLFVKFVATGRTKFGRGSAGEWTFALPIDAKRDPRTAIENERD